MENCKFVLLVLVLVAKHVYCVRSELDNQELYTENATTTDSNVIIESTVLLSNDTIESVSTLSNETFESATTVSNVTVDSVTINSTLVSNSSTAASNVSASEIVTSSSLISASNVSSSDMETSSSSLTSSTTRPFPTQEAIEASNTTGSELCGKPVVDYSDFFPYSARYGRTAEIVLICLVVFFFLTTFFMVIKYYHLQAQAGGYDVFFSSKQTFDNPSYDIRIEERFERIQDTY